AARAAGPAVRPGEVFGVPENWRCSRVRRSWAPAREWELHGKLRRPVAPGKPSRTPRVHLPAHLPSTAGNSRGPVRRERSGSETEALEEPLFLLRFDARLEFDERLESAATQFLAK